MASENNVLCTYLKGTAEGAVCTLMGCFVREIRFTEIKLCFGAYVDCSIFRRYAATSSDKKHAIGKL